MKQRVLCGGGALAQGVRTGSRLSRGVAVVVAALLLVACASSFVKPLHVDSDWPTTLVQAVEAHAADASRGYCNKFFCLDDPEVFVPYSFHPPPLVWLTLLLGRLGVLPEMAARAGGALGLLALFLGTWLATKRRSASPLMLAIAAVYSPIVLASFTNGSNEPAVSGLAVLALGMFVAALDARRGWVAFASGALVGLTLLVRYRPSAVMVFAVLVFLFDRDRRRLAASQLLGVGVVFGLWQLWFTVVYGAPHPIPTWLAVQKMGTDIGSEFSGVGLRFGAFATTAGAALMSPFVGWMMLGDRRHPVAMILVPMLVATSTAVFGVVSGYRVQMVLWPFALALAGGGVVASVWVLWKHAHTHRDQVLRHAPLTTLLLVLIASAGVGFTNARYFITALPFVLLAAELAMRRSRDPTEFTRRERRLPMLIAVVTVPVGALIQVADIRFAQAIDDATTWAVNVNAAEARAAGEAQRLWHVHEWGVLTRLSSDPTASFLSDRENIYLGRNELSDLDDSGPIRVVRRDAPVKGERCLRISNVTMFKLQNLDARCPAREGALHYRSPDEFPLRVMDFTTRAGLYSDGWGLAPFTIGFGPLVEARIDRVVGP